eukprot:CAMPEP_0119331798 /NCGR_PEP_ID=MMETSP1333-20130426/81418_1 /TAXON_ID=418940 /ORGANISM="Scyphosphaera apsteinii, Strain RCC1455" /LENGTH=50 /DNA_ID=CAMNT_0007341483 /DNA_START=46 /DNA_END=195 /DNA_ORIENTATION=+
MSINSISAKKKTSPNAMLAKIGIEFSKFESSTLVSTSYEGRMAPSEVNSN